MPQSQGVAGFMQSDGKQIHIRSESPQFIEVEVRLPRLAPS